MTAQLPIEIAEEPAPEPRRNSPATDGSCLCERDGTDNGTCPAPGLCACLGPPSELLGKSARYLNRHAALVVGLGLLPAILGRPEAHRC